MADKELRIVNKEGKLMSYRGQQLIFNTNEEGKASGLTERERAETLCWLLNREAENGPFYVEEVEEME